MGVLSKLRKKGQGFQDKTRTKEEIDQEYNHHAVMYGHATRLIAENEKSREHHLEAMLRLAEEGRKTPLPEAKPDAKTEAQAEAPEGTA